jgi:CheY-like chemotaxis protein
MSDPAAPVGHRHARFLVDRLRRLGLEMEFLEDELAGVGVLPLTSAPFPSLRGSFVSEQARFYTLGHNRIKVFDPISLFALPALEIARCESVDDLESLLRHAWADHVGELMDAYRWLERLGAPARTDPQGSQLLMDLTDVQGSAVRIRSRRELLIPSSGSLRDISLEGPEERIYRPIAGLEHAMELEGGIQAAMSDLASRERQIADAPTSPTSPVDTPTKGEPRILLVDDDRGVRAAAESALALRGFLVDPQPDPLRALDALRKQTYDAVLADARMPRMDGLELAVQIRDLPGLAKLPILIFDERPSPDSKEAAQSLGAVGYVATPSRWTDLAESLLDLLDGWSQRRFERYAVRLKVEVGEGAGAAPDLTYQVGRGGMGVKTRRDAMPGTVERYTITLPRGQGTLQAEGTVVHRLAEPGQVTLKLGIRFTRFPDRDEPRWIRLIDLLARRGAQKGR